jgi:NADPH:quinone reductase-like Zn-dependent oxidoreductase
MGHARSEEYTPEAEYQLPVLQALVDLGGSAPIESVLERVEQLMRGVLREVDYEGFERNPRQRWNNQARWARQRLADKGQIKPYVKGNRGLWEISEAGRERLQRAKGKE